MRAPLNLASEPAGNERLPTLLFTLAAVVLTLATVKHAFVVAELASTAATRLDQEVDQLQGQLVSLRQREQGLGRVRPPAASVERWALLKGLVDQRTFSWTELLGRLETALPPDVRLIGIQPENAKGRIKLSLDAVARGAEDALSVVAALESRPEFEGVLVLSIGEGRQGVLARYEMFYRPEIRGAAEPATATAKAATSRGEPGP